MGDTRGLMSRASSLWTGSAFALAAGLMWGLVFVGPLLLPEYPAALQSFGRYLAFGLIALPLAWLDRATLRQLTRADWIEALKLALVGNIVYYLFLASAIQRAGGPLPTMIIGTLPVVIAITSNLRDAARDGRLPWVQLAPSLLLIAAGIACVNHAEIRALRADPAPTSPATRSAPCSRGCRRLLDVVPDPQRRLAARPSRSQAARLGDRARGRHAAAGVARLSRCGGVGRPCGDEPFAMPFGPRPLFFISLMFAIGLFASWLGTLCWNEASQRLPTTLAGQLIVFETLAALAYAFVLRGLAPEPLTLLGIGLLVAGVAWALRAKPEPLAAQAHAA